MAEPLRKFACPSCNAPLKAEPNQKIIECRYCHTSVEVPSSSPSVVIIQQGVPAFSRTASFGSTSRINLQKSVVIIFLFLILFSAGLVFFARRQAISPTQRPFMISSSPSIPQKSGKKLSENKAEQNPPVKDSVQVGDVFFHVPAVMNQSGLILLLVQSNHVYYQLTALDETKPLKIWLGPSFSKESLATLFITADDEQIYIFDQTRLLAIKRENGTQVWEVALTEGLPTRNKEKSVHLSKDRITFLSKEGMLQFFDTHNGKRVNAIRLAEVPSRIENILGAPAVINLVVDHEPKFRALQIFDPITGDVAKQLVPQGENYQRPGSVQMLTSDSTIFTDAKEQAIYFLFGFAEPFHIQRFTLQKKIWASKILGSGALQMYQSKNPFIADGKLVLSSGHRIVFAETAKGKLSFLPEFLEHYIYPISHREEQLILYASKERGEELGEIWAISAKTGKQLWSYLPEKGSMFVGSNSFGMECQFSKCEFTSDSEKPIWTFFLGNKELTVFQALPQQRKIVFEKVDLTLGTRPKRIDIQIPWNSSNTLVKVTEDHAWFRSSSYLYRVSLQTGQIDYRWPSTP